MSSSQFSHWNPLVKAERQNPKFSFDFYCHESVLTHELCIISSNNSNHSKLEAGETSQKLRAVSAHNCLYVAPLSVTLMLSIKLFWQLHWGWQTWGMVSMPPVLAQSLQADTIHLGFGDLLEPVIIGISCENG